MAEEAYLVAFDIQEAGPGLQLKPAEKLGAKEETSIGFTEYETGGLAAAKSGLNGAAICKLVEVKSGSAAEAAEVVRARYSSNAGAVRAVVKPNTNFKLIA